RRTAARTASRSEAPAPLHRYIAAKGSITVDGVSLTVNAVEGRTFGLNIIPPHLGGHDAGRPESRRRGQSRDRHAGAIPRAVAGDG
ncbi:hypothetical protein GMDG_08851, partial [Pseudogymnoascus destructans 20631-21]